MANFKCDSIEIDIPDSSVGIVKDWIKTRDDKIDSLAISIIAQDKQLADYKKSTEEQSGIIEAQKVKLDSLTVEIEKLQNSVPNTEAVKERRKLERLATPLLTAKDSDFKNDSFDELSDRNLKEVIVSLSLPNLQSVVNNNLNEVSDVKLDAYLEVASENINVINVKTDSTSPLRKLLSNVVKTDSIDDLDVIKNEVKKENENAWKTLLGSK